MRIFTAGGDIPFTLSRFPDGQPHFVLDLLEDPYCPVWIESKLGSMDDLLNILMAADVLRHNGLEIHLNIRYMLGARMDRRMHQRWPFTLEIICRMLNGAGFKSINILDPHSSVATTLLGADAVYPIRPFAQILAKYGETDSAIVVPDKGAVGRVNLLMASARSRLPVAYASKHRDPISAVLSSPTLDNEDVVKGKRCLIVDDICDGGGTFTMLAELLLAKGATSVDLFVTHGIFSRGPAIKWIDQIYSTDSIWPNGSTDKLTVIPFSMGIL